VHGPTGKVDLDRSVCLKEAELQYIRCDQGLLKPDRWEHGKAQPGSKAGEGKAKVLKLNPSTLTQYTGVSDVREPIISGVVKIRALGKSFFKQLHYQYTSPKTHSEFVPIANGGRTTRCSAWRRGSTTKKN